MIASQENPVQHPGIPGRRVNPRIIEKGGGSSIIPDIGNGLFDLLFHEVIKKNTAAPVGQDYAVKREAFCQSIDLLKGHRSFPGIEVPHRFIGMNHHREVPVGAAHIHDGFQPVQGLFVYTREIKGQLPHP